MCYLKQNLLNIKNTYLKLKNKTSTTSLLFFKDGEPDCIRGPHFKIKIWCEPHKLFGGAIQVRPSFIDGFPKSDHVAFLKLCPNATHLRPKTLVITKSKGYDFKPFLNSPVFLKKTRDDKKRSSLCNCLSISRFSSENLVLTKKTRISPVMERWFVLRLFL